MGGQKDSWDDGHMDGQKDSWDDDIWADRKTAGMTDI